MRFRQFQPKRIDNLFNFLHIGSYVIGWMPGTIVFILVCKDCLLKFDWVNGNGQFFVYNAINCLIILKTMVNPIIYAARMHEIKMATRRMHASLCGCLGLTNFASETIGMGHSSEGNPSNRASLSRTAVCRLTSNVSLRNPRNGSFTYTYTGNGVQAQSDTILWKRTEFVRMQRLDSRRITMTNKRASKA